MKLIKLAVSIAICFLASYLGSLLTFPSISTWYAGLNKAPFNPPNWIFGPVWTLLFLLMGISFYLVWDKGMKMKEARFAVLVFFLQLLFNVGWSAVFFFFHSPLAAFIVIILLWLAILAMIISFRRISALAGWLQIPYLLWVSFASVLNLFVVLLNR